MSMELKASAFMEIIEDWLMSMPEKLKVECENTSQRALENTLTDLGYGAPYDTEQRLIKEKLVQARAGRMASLVVWGYYQDYKVCSQTY